MHILQVVAGLPPGGGISESVPALCRHLRRLGHEVTLATLDGPLSEAALLAERDGVRLLRFAPSRPGALFFSAAMLRGFASLAAGSDVVHVHSNWTFPVWWACRCALKAGRPLVMSPRGCLDPVRLRHSAWKKRLVGWLDRFFLRRAAVIHATCQAEAEGVEKFLGGRRQAAVGNRQSAVGNRQSAVGHEDGGVKRRIVVIPNGVETGGRQQAASGSERAREEATNRAKDANGSRTRTVLYLGRLHPLKGLDLLIGAWGRLRKAVNSQPLTVNGKPSTVNGKPSTVNSKPLTVNGEAWADGQEFTVNASRLTDHGFPWQLVIVGPDEQGTLARLSAQAESQGMAVSCKPLTVNSDRMTDRQRLTPYGSRLTAYGSRLTAAADIVVTGPLYGVEKARIMAAADLFVLPTRSENFGIVVAEALACGVPVICTKGAPWSELLGNEGNVNGKQLTVNSGWDSNDCRESDGKKRQTVNGLRLTEHSATGRCGWWVDIGEEPLAEALRQAMRLTDEERHALGENGRRLVEAKYRWETVAGEMAAVYSGIVSRKP